jgi:hypothetical protein
MAEKRGRRAGFAMSNEHRGKIQNSSILRALIEHVEGTREMSATQVTAGLGLLRKVLPDLAATADAGEAGELVPVKRMSDDELEAIAAGGGARTAATTQSTSRLN